MSEETVPSERVEYWKARWNEGQIGFHQPDVHKMLLKYVAKLLPEGKANKVFFPLCGKTLDMKWIYDEGFTVVGVEGVKSAIVQFFAEQNIEYSEEDVELKGEIFKLLKSKDGRIRLYWTDILKFSLDFEGTIDAVWDRGSLVALDRKDVPDLTQIKSRNLLPVEIFYPKYVQVIKSILSTKGHILLEVMEYDVSIMNEIQGPDKPPPPHPMYETELKKLYEPECKVEFLERGERKVYGKDVHTAIYNIYK